MIAVLVVIIGLLYVAYVALTPQVIRDGFGNPYLVRYFVFALRLPGVEKQWSSPRIYLHHILRSDHDRHLHDHPWNFVSILLKGGYTEYVDIRSAVGREGWLRSATNGQARQRFDALTILKRGAGWRHRLVLEYGETTWTLVFLGPKVRSWGFWIADTFCPWRKYDSRLGVCEDGQ